MKTLSRMMIDAESGLKNLRKSTMDILSLVTSTGKTVATLTYNRTERRDVKVVAPYGVASSGTEGMAAQVICNDSDRDTSMVGVYDPDKPDVGPGENILYAGFGQRIMMLSDGEMVFINGNGKQLTLTEIFDHINGA